MNDWISGSDKSGREPQYNPGENVHMVASIKPKVTENKSQMLMFSLRPKTGNFTNRILEIPGCLLGFRD